MSIPLRKPRSRPDRRSLALMCSMCAHASLLLLALGSAQTAVQAEWRMSLSGPSRPMELWNPVPVEAPQEAAVPEVVAEPVEQELTLADPLPEIAAEPPSKETPAEAEPILPLLVPPPPSTWMTQVTRRSPAEPQSTATAGPDAPTAAEADDLGEGGSSDPRPLAAINKPPFYPAMAVSRGFQGTVVVLLVVDENGRVVEALIEQSSGHGVLDDSALKALSSWRFEPATAGGQPTRATHRQSVQFRYNGASPGVGLTAVDAD
jgi:protein TonB